MIKLLGFCNEAVVAEVAVKLGLSGLNVGVERNEMGGLDLIASFEPLPEVDGDHEPDFDRVIGSRTKSKH